MPYRYEMVSTNNMTFRPAPNVASGTIPPYKVTAGVKMYGNEVAPGNGADALAGDNWLHVLQIGSTAVNGWVAEIHKGEKLCTLTDNGPSEPPPSNQAPEFHITSSGNEYYPPFDFTVKPK